jgi:hypothetical protein
MNAQTTRWDVIWRMTVLGLGIGPALPLLNLALQNAVPHDKVGSATASRQFFQQLGQALGAAIFGVILTTTLASQIQQNFQPIVAQLPAELQSRFDPAQFTQGSTQNEGTGGEQIDVGARITNEITAQFDQQRQLFTAAIQNNDPQAQQTLLSNPQTPESVRQLLQAGGLDAQAREQALAQALGGLDTAQTEALAQGQQIGAQITDALKVSFANSITQIYRIAIWLVAAALALIAFLLPEIPLRTTNRTDMAQSFE